ncbi:MAG: DUF4397 domain-containing protein, partial [Chloroflexota bacterium]
MHKLMRLLTMMALFALTLFSVSAQEDAGTAEIRVGHFSPDAPNVDIYVNGDLTIENLAYTQVTPFLELPADTYTVAVAPAGTAVDDAVIGPVDITLEADTNTTVGAVGSVEDGTLAATVFTEDFTEPTDSNNAIITVLHAIEGEGAVNVEGSGITLIEALRYPDTGAGTDGAFTREVPQGTYMLNVTVSATDVTVRTVSGVDINPGDIFLIVALGPQSNDGDILIVTPDGNLEETSEDMADMSDEDMGDETDEADDSEDMADEEADDMDDMDMMEGTAEIRVGHFSPDAPNVDVYIDGEVAIEDLAYTQVTPFIEVDAGTYEIAVAPTGTSLDDAVIGPVDLTFEPDSNTTVAAVGSAEDGTLTATVFTEDFTEPTDSNNAIITVLHAIEGEGAVNVVGSGITLVEALRYPDADAGADGAFTREVPQGTYTLNINVPATGVTVRTISGVDINPGDIFLIVALGPQSND